MGMGQPGAAAELSPCARGSVMPEAPDPRGLAGQQSASGPTGSQAEMAPLAPGVQQAPPLLNPPGKATASCHGWQKAPCCAQVQEERRGCGERSPLGFHRWPLTG